MANENIQSTFPTNYIDLTYIPDSAPTPLQGRRIYLDSDQGELAVVDTNGNITLLETRVQELYIQGATDVLTGTVELIPGTGISLSQSVGAGTITITADSSNLIVQQSATTKLTNPTTLNFSDPDNFFISESPDDTALINLSTYGLLSGRSTTQTWLGDNEFATTLTIPHGTSPTVDGAGEIAVDVDTDNSNITQGSVVYYDGTRKMYVIAVDTLPTTDDHVLTYDGTNKKYVFQAQSGGGGGTPTSISRTFCLMGA